jgi:hypothetical protein
MVNRIKVSPQTKEQIEYEEAKKSFRIATAKARLYSGGIDPSKVSQQVVDKVVRIFDDMDYIGQDTQQKTSNVQRDAEAKIQKINQDANQKYGEIQKKYQDLMNSLKEVTVSVSQVGEQAQVVTQSDAQSGTDATAEIEAETAKEEVREKTHEEKVSEIADILLHAMRGQIVEKANEIMCTLDKKTSDIVAKGTVNELETGVQIGEAEKGVPIEEVEKAAPEEVKKVIPEEEIRQAIYKDIA